MAAPLRIYSETLPYEVVVRPATRALLARYDLELVLAVRPWQLPELPRTARTLRDAGIRMAVWPMLSDEAGRWANVENASSFVGLVHDVCDALDAVAAPPSAVLFDLEPPFAHAQALASAPGGPGLLRVARGVVRPCRASARAAFDAAGGALAGLVSDLHARGVATSSAVWPLVALDPRGGHGWQTLLGTPVDVLATRRTTVMMYTSILEGWSRGALKRLDAMALLVAAGERTVWRWGARGGLSLGCVGTGAFEDEPTYRNPRELAEDASLAREAGCDDLSLFDLGGVLARPPPEAWLDAFAGNCQVGPGPLKRRYRVLAASRIVRVMTRMLHSCSRTGS
jgi:hypothetical protein